jgi:hypothetical protein
MSAGVISSVVGAFRASARRDLVALIAGNSDGLVADCLLAVRESNRKVATAARKLGVGPLEREAGLDIVVEAGLAPGHGGGVALTARGVPVDSELSPMLVAVTRGALGGRTSEAPKDERASVSPCILPLRSSRDLDVALFTGGRGVCALEGKSGGLLVIERI